jgi:serine/threonine protein kinase
MAPKLPERYETQVRLGRDGDIEEWLATDTSLDRPVLVRILEASATPERRQAFIADIRAAAAAHHVSLSEVYSIGSVDNPFTVVEWHGGVSLADRLRAGETLTVAEFLSGGPQLAAGLAALHASGTSHGSIDTAAIGFAGNQPAKLAAFGRRSRYGERRADTAALAAAFRISITGRDVPGVRPSQVAEGLPGAVDTILSDAESGALSAEALAAQLRALPPPEITDRRSSWSWRWTGVSAALVAVALGIAATGGTIEVDPSSPFLFPAVPADGLATPPTVVTLPPLTGSPALVTEAVGWDPSGSDFPDPDDLALILDDARSTAWTTDTYFTPFGTDKEGIGVAFTVSGTPRRVEIVGTPGTTYRLMWGESVGDDLGDWQPLWSGTLLDGPNLARVPARNKGTWLLWLTGVPERDPGRYSAEIALVRFLP